MTNIKIGWLDQLVAIACFLHDLSESEVSGLEKRGWREEVVEMIWRYFDYRDREDEEEEERGKFRRKEGEMRRSASKRSRGGSSKREGGRRDGSKSFRVEEERTGVKRDKEEGSGREKTREGQK